MKTRILMIDNRDSFVWNLVRYLEILQADTDVIRCDRLNLDDVLKTPYDGVMISPGPGIPEKAGLLMPLLEQFKDKKPQIPLLGVCLGHQALACLFGARIIRGEKPMYGKLSKVYHDSIGLFCALPDPLTVTRYHALVVDPDTVPDCLTVSCRSEDGAIMGLRHQSLPYESVQFHPEAVLTEHGLAMIRNYLRCVDEASD